MCTCIYVTDCHIKYNKTARKERERDMKRRNFAPLSKCSQVDVSKFNNHS